MITSVYVSGGGPHRTLTVRWKGQTIGELKVAAEDVVQVVYALNPQKVEPEEIGRKLQPQRWETNPMKADR